jgi:light-regulated signal transduction histidine kinase (bacteriophytochrome)
MTASRPVSPAPAPNRSATVEEEFQSFSYIASHDLAASFRLVGEFSRLLLADLGDGLTDRQKLYAGHIQAAVGNGQMMLDQLLAFSRVQQKPVEKVRHDADAVMRFCLLQLNAQIGASGAEVTLDPLGEIQADPKLMGMAFNAVLDNAIKFRRPEAPLRIRIGPAHDRGAWRVRIQDNGRGVEPAHREKAFEMFRRLGHDEGLAGVGAGLAICRRIARRHGGDAVFLDCAEGACVELSLPRR